MKNTPLRSGSQHVSERTSSTYFFMYSTSHKKEGKWSVRDFSSPAYNRKGVKEGATLVHLASSYSTTGKKRNNKKGRGRHHVKKKTLVCQQ